MLTMLTNLDLNKMKKKKRKEYTDLDEHWVYRIVESLYHTPETNITLYVNYTRIKIKNKIKK